MGGKRREGEGQGGKWERGARDARQEPGDRRAAAGKAGATAEKEGPEGAPKPRGERRGGLARSPAEEGGWALPHPSPGVFPTVFLDSKPMNSLRLCPLSQVQQSDSDSQK